jgi:hypothetical protein
MPCNASSASMFADAFGAVAARVSWGVVVSGSVKLLELERRVVEAGVPSVVPFGP